MATNAMNAALTQGAAFSVSTRLISAVISGLRGFDSHEFHEVFLGGVFGLDLAGDAAVRPGCRCGPDTEDFLELGDDDDGLALRHTC